MDPRLFDAFADRFAETRSEPWLQAVTFRDGLPDDARVLDLGCANGRHMDARCVGVDASRRLLGLNPHGERLLQGLAQAIPCADGSFDAVLCVAVLHHFQDYEDRAAIVEEVVRVARSGAPVLFSCWRHDQPRFEDGPADVEVPFTDADGEEHLRPYHLFVAGELAGHLQKAGIDGALGWSAGQNHWARGRVP